MGNKQVPYFPQEQSWTQPTSFVCLVPSESLK